MQNEKAKEKKRDYIIKYKTNYRLNEEYNNHIKHISINIKIICQYFQIKYIYIKKISSLPYLFSITYKSTRSNHIQNIFIFQCAIPSHIYINMSNIVDFISKKSYH